MRSSRGTYAVAGIACALLWLIAPPAAIVMSAIVVANALDEWVCSAPDPEPATELYEGTFYSCTCHERMGNDFYFLPMSCCYKGKCDGRDRNTDPAGR